jgi:hypothetical protein
MVMLTLAMMFQSAAAAAPDVGPLWAFLQPVLISLTAAAAVWSATTMHRLIKRQDRMENIVVGVDGKNGLRSKVEVLDGRISTVDERVDLIDERHGLEDHLAKAAREQYQGEEKRRELRRAEDILASLLHIDRPTEGGMT